MTRWLLNTFPTLVLALLIVGGLVTFAVVGQYFVRRRWPLTSGGEHNDVAGVLLGLVGAVYGIVLAFVIVALYEQYQAANANVRQEATEIAQIQRDTAGFEPRVAEEIRRELVDYVRTVLGEEWELMKDGKFSQRAWDDIDALYDTLQAYEPQTDSQSAFYGEAVAKVNELVSARRERLHFAEDALPGAFQVLIVGGALLLVGFMYFIGIPSIRVQMAMIASIAALIAFNLLLIVLLDHPFSGDVGVSDAPFREGSLARLLDE